MRLLGRGRHCSRWGDTKLSITLAYILYSGIYPGTNALLSCNGTHINGFHVHIKSCRA